MQTTLEPTVAETLAAAAPKREIVIHSVLSAPRFGPTDCFHSIAQCLIKYNIDFDKVGGANWGQNLERALDSALEQNPDWILTWDFDTVIRPWQFERLINLIGTHGHEYDAIAPLEVRRECSDVLASFRDYSDQKELFADLDRLDVVPATTAHFGCTLIKADILRKMPKPWLHHVPAPNGGWGPGRMDDDIGFWHKLRDAGGKLGIASRVCIGHSQIMVTWLLDNGKVVHQHMNDYSKNGPPENVRK